MPAVKIGLDLDTRKFTAASGATLQTFSGKKGSIIDFQMAITQGGASLNLPNGSTVEVGMKKVDADAGTLLFHTTATRSGWGTGTRWFFRIDLTGDAFDTTVVGRPVDLEALMILPDGQRIASLTMSFTVQKNVME